MRMVAPFRQPAIQITGRILRLRLDGLNLDLPLWINPYCSHGKPGLSDGFYSARQRVGAKSPATFGHEIFLI
jgi:hypothetical protein